MVIRIRYVQLQRQVINGNVQWSIRTPINIQGYSCSRVEFIKSQFVEQPRFLFGTTLTWNSYSSNTYKAFALYMSHFIKAFEELSQSEFYIKARIGQGQRGILPPYTTVCMTQDACSTIGVYTPMDLKKEIRKQCNIDNTIIERNNNIFVINDFLQIETGHCKIQMQIGQIEHCRNYLKKTYLCPYSLELYADPLPALILYKRPQMNTTIQDEEKNLSF